MDSKENGEDSDKKPGGGIGRIWMHFDDELGVLSMLGSAITGGGLTALLSASGAEPVGAEIASLVAGLVLISLDYFI